MQRRHARPCTLVFGWGCCALMVSACGGGGGGGSPPQPQPQPQMTPAPVVTLSAAATTVAAGTATNLSWSATSATSCTASGGWTGSQPTSGSLAVTVNQQTTYSLSCTGAGGTGSAQVAIAVSAPTVSLTASPPYVPAGSQTTLTWSSTGATSCTAAGGWAGSRPLSGSVVLTLSQQTTFSLSCDGAGGNGGAQVSVDVAPAWLKTRGIKLWMSNNPAALFNEYTGVTPDLAHYELWHNVLQEIRAVGATEVTFQLSTGVMVNATDNDYSSTLSYNPPQDQLIALADDARSQGLAVTVSFFSHVQNVITGGGGLDRPNPTDFPTWFTHHRTKILDAARLARALDARAMIYMQDETQHLLRDPAHAAEWAQLVRDVRTEFHGTVSTTWWTPGGGDSISAISPSIIAEVDSLGIGLFPNLVRAEEPDLPTLCSAYHHDADGHDVLAFIESLHTTYGKPIWITDKAFHSFKGASYDEWRVFDSTIPLTPDESMQVRLYESFFGVLATKNPTWLEGVSLQNFNNLKDGANSWIARFVDGPLSESPQHKLAESVISDWFNGRRTTGC